MRLRARPLWICAAAWLCLALAQAAEPLPSDVKAALNASGLPLRSFGFYVQPVDADEAGASSALAALNAEQPFMMASTAKLVTSLAALDLLGPTHGWRTQAYATAPVVNGRLNGDLVIVGGHAGLTPDDLGRWFKQMHGEGLTDITGRIVLRDLALLHEEPAAIAPVGLTKVAAEAPRPAVAARQRPLVVSVQPAAGAKALVTLQPRPLGVIVVNDVFMGGACSAWAQWSNVAGAGPQLWVRGRWDASCGGRDIAYVRAPPAAVLAPQGLPFNAAPTPAASAAHIVNGLWAESGGTLRGRVAGGSHTVVPSARAAGWSSEFLTPLPELIREMNKTSNNVAARNLLLSLSGESGPGRAPLREAQDRVHAWLREQGLADGDIRIDVGSGQSRAERGKPRAMVHLLLNAWRSGGAKALLDSLPIAGVDGTLVHRMQHGSATGQAYLKTGTLSDTRALAGYVHAKSGKVYAVAAMVNHPAASRAIPALDAFIEWVANNG